MAQLNLVWDHHGQAGSYWAVSNPGSLSLGQTVSSELSPHHELIWQPSQLALAAAPRHALPAML